MPPATVAADVRRIVADSLRGASVRRTTTLTEQIDASIVPERLVASVSGFFGMVAALLAAIGLYGLLDDTVVRRTGEIGIRMALGATPRDVIGLVLKQVLSLVGLGLCVGGPLVLGTRRLAGSILEGTTTVTWLPFLAAACAMIAVAVLAAYVPASRAARVEPVVALRSE